MPGLLVAERHGGLIITRGVSERGQAVLARMVAWNSLILILTSIFIGAQILAFFGLSLPVVQVGGGLIVISTGWTLLRQSDDDGAEKNAHKGCNDSDYTRRAFYPLTLPLTVGPGSISVAIAVAVGVISGLYPAWRSSRLMPSQALHI